MKKEYVKKLHSFQTTAFNEMKKKTNCVCLIRTKIHRTHNQMEKIVGKHETSTESHCPRFHCIVYVYVHESRHECCVPY